MAEAAASSDTEEADRVILECAVCLSNVTNHRALTCQHTFCQKCLEPLVQGQTISCPVCREVCHMKGPDVSCLPRNLTLVALMDKMCQNCKRNDKDVSCKHCGKQLCLQCFELCKADIDTQKKDTQDDILQLMSSGRTVLRQIQDDTIRVHEQITTATKQVAVAGEEKTRANELQYQTLTEELAALKLRHKQLSEEIKANETRQKEVQDEMKTFETCPNQFQKKIEHRQKELRQEIETEGKSEIERLGKLYKDIDKNMERMESVLSEIRAHSYDKKDPSNISNICEKWKAKSSEFKQLQVVTHQMHLHVDTILDPSGEANIGRFCAFKCPMQPISYKSIDYQSKGVPQHTVGCKGSGPGQFHKPSNVCVSPITGNIVVCDKGNHRIQVFDNKLQFLFKFGSYGSGDGQFDFSPYDGVGGVCVTPKSHIVVADTGNHRLQVFTEKGEHIRCIGPKLGQNEYISKPLTVGVDLSGQLYVNNYGTKHVLVLEENGTIVRIIRSPHGRWEPRGLAISPNGDVVVADRDGKLELYTRVKHKISPLVKRSERLWDVAVDARGNIIVTSVGTTRIDVFNADKGHVHSFYLHSKTTGNLTTFYVAITNDGRVVVVDQYSHSVNIL